MTAKLFGLSENPFKITPDPRFVHRYGAFERALCDIRDTVRNGSGAAILTGGPGIGKTMLLTVLAEELRQDAASDGVVLLNCGPDMTAEALLSRADAVRTERSRRPVLLLDEAQNLTADELRRLLAAADPGGTAPPGIRMVLASTPDLEPLLGPGTPAKGDRRIALHLQLQPLSQDEIEAYIATRLRVLDRRPDALFSEAALAAIARYTSGIPRLINTLCATTLFLAEFETHRRVSADLVKEAARSLDLVRSDVARVAHPPPMLALPSRPAALPVSSSSRPALPPSHLDRTRPEVQQKRDRPGLVLAVVTAASLALLIIGQDLVPDGEATGPSAAREPSAGNVPVATAAADDRVLPAIVLDGGSAGSRQPPPQNGGQEEVMPENEIAQLLLRADEQIATLKLTTPAGDNALNTYREILALMPGHEAAVTGIYDLGGKYAELSTAAAREGRTSAARLYYERGITVAPQHPALLALTPELWTKASQRSPTVQVEEAGNARDTLSLTEPWENRGRRR